jgi:hypothetical protein
MTGSDSMSNIDNSSEVYISIQCYLAADCLRDASLCSRLLLQQQ